MSTDRFAEDEMLVSLMDQLPIYATRIGFRDTSTPDQQKIGDALFAAHRAWKEAMER